MLRNIIPPCIKNLTNNRISWSPNQLITCFTCDFSPDYKLFLIKNYLLTLIKPEYFQITIILDPFLGILHETKENRSSHKSSQHKAGFFTMWSSRYSVPGFLLSRALPSLQCGGLSSAQLSDGLSPLALTTYFILCHMNLNVVISGSGRSKNREGVRTEKTSRSRQKVVIREICLFTSVNTELYFI